MKWTLTAFAGASLLVAALASGAQKQGEAERQLKAAMNTELVDGNLKAAIEQYKKVAQSSNRAVAAQALLHMADCYQKLGDAQARATFQRIVREYGDQKEAAAAAQARLDVEAGGANGAASRAAGKAARQIWTTDLQPDSVSPDGRYVSFTDWATEDLGVRDLITGAERLLTHNSPDDFDAYPEDPIFSPDGSQIFYSWNFFKEHRSEMRVIPVAGGTPRTVRGSKDQDGYVEPQSWHPDGKQVLVLNFPEPGASQLALLSLRDGSIRSLKSFGWQNLTATFSPDGRWIAFDSPPDQKTQQRDIFVLATDASRELRVVQNPANDARPMWSPDGSTILFFSDRTGQMSLWSVPFANGKVGEAKLTHADIRSRHSWMTRSGTLYYSISGTSSSNIYSAELDDDMNISKGPVLAVENFVNSNAGASVSPDGAYLAYLSRPGLVVRTLKTGEERVIPTQTPINLGINIGILWFPDGHSVLAASNLPQGPGTNLYRIDLRTGAAEFLLRSNQGPFEGVALSRDGKSIFYAADTDDHHGRLSRFDIESKRETELKAVNGDFRGVIVSPDGKQIAYSVLEKGYGVGPDQGSYIAVMPSDGGASRELFRGRLWGGTRRWILSWSPDRRYVLFVREGIPTASVSALWRVPVSGGPAEQRGPSVRGVLTFPQIHPDGRRLFFTGNETSPNEVWALENLLSPVRASK